LQHVALAPPERRWCMAVTGKFVPRRIDTRQWMRRRAAVDWPARNPPSWEASVEHKHIRHTHRPAENDEKLLPKPRPRVRWTAMPATTNRPESPPRARAAKKSAHSCVVVHNDLVVHRHAVCTRPAARNRTHGRLCCVWREPQTPCEIERTGPCGCVSRAGQCAHTE